MRNKTKNFIVIVCLMSLGFLALLGIQASTVYDTSQHAYTCSFHGHGVCTPVEHVMTWERMLTFTLENNLAYLLASLMVLGVVIYFSYIFFTKLKHHLVQAINFLSNSITSYLADGILQPIL